jgi:hypothetical protein
MNANLGVQTNAVKQAARFSSDGKKLKRAADRYPVPQLISLIQDGVSEKSRPRDPSSTPTIVESAMTNA